VARFALPVERRVGAVQNVERDRASAPCASTIRPPHAAEARSGGVPLDRLGIGEQQVAVAQGRLLLAKKQLGGAQLQRIVAAVEDVPQITCASCPMNSGGTSTAPLNRLM